LSFNLHTVHHLFPWVPWYDLRRAQDLMRRYSPELGEENNDEFSWLFKRRTISFSQAFHAYIRKPATLK